MTERRHMMDGLSAAEKRSVRVSIETACGSIIAEIFMDNAPITAGNFLRRIDEGLYQGATFYRAVRPDNDDRLPKVRVVQGGIDPTDQQAPLLPIAHESTKQTGLTHMDGALSMARWEPGSATSEFFIVIGDTPELDFGGARNPDGQGFAVFGRVVAGMELVRQINASSTDKPTTVEYLKNQALMEPVSMHIVRLPEAPL